MLKSKSTTAYLFIVIALFVFSQLVSCSSDDDDDNDDASDSLDVSGYWYSWHGGQIDPVDTPGFLYIEQNGAKIVVSHSCYSAGEWANGTLDGDQLTLTWTLTELDGSEVDGSFTGTVSAAGDTIVGESPDGDTVTLRQSGEHFCHPENEGTVVTEDPAKSKNGDLTTTADDSPISCRTGINTGVHWARGSTYGNLKGDPHETTATGTYVPEELTCIEQSYAAAIDRQTDDAPRLVTTEIGQIFPGSLLQGGQFLDGIIAPITGTRGSGTLVLSGMTCDGDADLTMTINSVTESKVTDALNTTLNDCKSANGEAAIINYKTQSVYSSDQMLFELGLKAGYEGVELSNQFSIDSSSASNYVLLKFNQVFYTVDFQVENNNSQNLFSDDTSCLARDFAVDNPTLIVDSVSYGRSIYFLVNSEYSERDIQDSLEGAYHGEADANLTATAKLTYKEVMSKSSVVYSVYGGDSSYATEPISADSPDAMYDAIKNVISNEQSSKWSLSNPAVPIAYTFAYADDLSTAIDTISTTYDQKSCSPQTGGFEMWVSNVNDDAYFYVDSHDKEHTENGDHKTYNITEDTKDHTIEFKVDNGNCGGSSAHFRLYRYGSLYWGRSYSHDWASTCGTQYYAQWDINSSSALTRKVEAEGYHGASWTSSDW